MLFGRQRNAGEPDRRPKWFNSPISCHEGLLSQIKEYLPDFERRSFALAGTDRTRLNERLDTIVRKPFGNDDDYVPIGVVSKEYTLVSHKEVVDVVTRAFKYADMDLNQLIAEMALTEYGERMALSLYLPDKYAFDPGDGHELSLRLECFNSVEGSMRFRVLMGWYRFVCSNGLVIGVTQADINRRHVGDIEIEAVPRVLSAGLQQAERDKKNFNYWQKIPVRMEDLEPWVVKSVKPAWGFKAAARTFHIARSGCDVEIVGQYKDQTPATIEVKQGKPVPGCPNACSNVYDISQVLAWLARDRRDIQEQLQWKEQIAGLINPLMKKRAARTC